MPEKETVFLVVPRYKGFDDRRNIEEIKSLIIAAGGITVGIYEFSFNFPDVAFGIPRNNVKKIAQEIQRLGADLCVFDYNLKPGQIRNLEKNIGNRVITRTDVILHIFANNAHTSEAALQVETAQLQNLFPKLSGKGKEMSRLGGGIGTRGPGETKLEVDRRHIRRRLAVLRKKLTLIEKRRELLRKKRPWSTIALVGYTNAGKTTLLNVLAKERLKTENAPFVTLDPVVRKIWISNDFILLISDTVGFISHLPHFLISSFRATLGEVIHADGIIHVVDASDDFPEEKIEIVEQILLELDENIKHKKMIYVFNKCDIANKGTLERLLKKWPDGIFVSAKTLEGIDVLKKRLLIFKKINKQN